MRLPRFYPILDTELLDARGFSAVEAAAALLDAGVRILQYRRKGPFTRARYEEAGRTAELSRQAGALFVVNDRADIAALLDDAGLHVGQEDLSPADARKVIGPSRVLGYSTHNEAQMREAAEQPVDYVAFGPVFGTASKRNPDPTVGLDLLRAVRRLTAKPLVAIGGITRETAASVFEAGADSVAVIGDLYPATLNAASLRGRAEEWRQFGG
mgnify:CR=1 FL=1